MAINPNSHIIAVTGGKGGVGKSVFAANLALSFLELKSPTLLIDMDAQSCGDQNVILGLREVKTLGDLASFSGALNPQMFASIITPHPKGLSFIAAVRSRDEGLKANAETVIKQIENLTNYFRYIVVDLGSNLGPLQMSLIEKATTLLCVTTPEVLAINQTMRLVNDLMIATVPQDMVHFVLNKSGPSGLTPEALEKTFRKQMLGVIPQDDITATGSVQRSNPFVIAAPQSPISRAHADVVRKLTGGILQSLKSQSRPQQFKFARAAEVEAAVPGVASSAQNSRDIDPRTAVKLSLHAELLKDSELRKSMGDTSNFGNDPEKEKALRLKTIGVISKIIDRDAAGIGRDERKSIIDEVVNEAVGLGPLEDLLNDPSVTEIMVNGPKKIFVEKKGIIQLSPINFTAEESLINVIHRIVDPLGRQINESSPYVDARLKDGSRVNAIIRPLAIDGPSITIRKFSKKTVTPENYYKDWNAATANMMEFLKICVQLHRNIIISGGTGSGKTTLLNTLSSFISSNERVVTIEDAAELQLKQEHVVRLESRPQNMEGKGQVSIRDLVRNALRMRPDRIVVGECRDGAALDMLSAMSTGHDGSMTTLHANSPKEAITRLETLCLMAGMDLPAKAIREQIANAVNVIVQISRLSDGSRKIMSIKVVEGIQGDVVTLQDVFDYKRKGVDEQRKITGSFQAAGLIPRFIQESQQNGNKIPAGLFSNEASNAAAALAAQKSAPPIANQPAAKQGNDQTITANPSLKKVVGGGR